MVRTSTPREGRPRLFPMRLRSSRSPCLATLGKVHLPGHVQGRCADTCSVFSPHVQNHPHSLHCRPPPSGLFPGYARRVFPDDCILVSATFYLSRRRRAERLRWRSGALVASAHRRHVAAMSRARLSAPGSESQCVLHATRRAVTESRCEHEAVLPQWPHSGATSHAPTHAHARAHAPTHARMHPRTHPSKHTHARIHTHARTKVAQVARAPHKTVGFFVLVSDPSYFSLAFTSRRIKQIICCSCDSGCVGCGVQPQVEN